MSRENTINPTRRNKDLRIPKEAFPELPSTPVHPVHSLFNPEYIHIATVMIEQGMRYRDLAKAFKVERVTLKKWMDKFPEFKEAILAAQDRFNSELIEKALVRRATGYEYVEDTEELKPVGRKIFSLETGKRISENEFALMEVSEGKKKAKTMVRIEPVMNMVLTKRVKKSVAPSERAIEFFLNNRTRMVSENDMIKPRWSPMNKIELTGAGGKDLIPDSISPEKLLAEMIMAQKKEDGVIEAEFEEAKKLGITTGEEEYEEEKPPR
jgi:hypothetical protein